MEISSANLNELKTDSLLTSFPLLTFIKKKLKKKKTVTPLIHFYLFLTDLYFKLIYLKKLWNL
jgi:hypothetical protein